MVQVNLQQIDPQIEKFWKEVLQNEFRASYFADLKAFLQEEKKQFRIYPPGPKIFNAFNLTPFEQVKVVILGQDPYHGPGQAHGLCFSVPDGIPKPPSLINIFQELNNDLKIPPHPSGNLEKWARQGVFLLNAILTVRESQPTSHQNKGWENFTNAAIKSLSDLRENLVFLLWGNYAIAKKNLIDPDKHLILTTVHPSPLSASRGFFGCRHFSKTNEYLISNGKEPVNWQL